MSERSIETVREYKLDPKEVIAGLNGYYESDKCNGYITVRRNDVEGPAYFTAALYLSALIEWLRVDNDIFYRPGLIFDQVEAARNAAKMCCLRAHIKDEISKRGIWCDKDADIPELVDTLFKAYDEEGERADKNRKDAVDLAKANRELKENICEDIMKYVRQEASRNGFDLPEEIDGEALTVKRVFHDLLELLRQHESKNRNAERETRKAVNDQLKKDTDYVADVLSTVLEALGISKSDTVHLDIFGLKTKAIQRASVIKSEHDRYLEQLDKAAADYQALDEENQKFKSAEKSDINKLIRDYCSKRGIVAPSRYLSDEACVEYLFSVSFAILQDLYRDIFKKQPDGLSAEDIANKILDRVLETEDLLHRSVDSVNKECKATGRLMVDKYEKDLLRFIYKEYKGRTHLSDETVTYDPPSVRNTVLKIISDYARSRTRVDILETRIKSIFDRCKAKFTVDDYVLNGDPTTSFMLDCISSWIDSPAPRDGWTNREIENLRGQISRLKDLINAMNEEVGDM